MLLSLRPSVCLEIKARHSTMGKPQGNRDSDVVNWNQSVYTFAGLRFHPVKMSAEVSDSQTY